MKIKHLILAVTGLVLGVLDSRAVDNLRISIVSSNVVLSWPSATGETYLVEYRERFIPESPWKLLASNHFAATGTNWTTFTHPNIVVFPPPCGTNSGGSFNGPPAFAMTLNSGEKVFVTDEGEVLEEEDYLPYPWNPRFLGKASLSAAKSGGNFQTLNSGEGGGENLSEPPCPYVTNSMGFYRVKAVRVLSGLTNGVTVSNIISIALRPDENVSQLRLLVDGAVFWGEGSIVGPFTNMVKFDFVDTARLTNGLHTFQIEGLWDYTQFEGQGFEKALSAKFTLSTSNEVTYPEWDDNVGDTSAEFRLVSAHPSVNWKIDIYNYLHYVAWVNGQTSAPAPIKVLTGSTNNGRIYANWNLVDTNGVTRTNIATDPFFISFVTTTLAGGGAPLAAGKVVPPQRQTPPWPSLGLWTITYQDVISGLRDPSGNMLDMMMGWLYAADDPDGTGDSVGVFYQDPIGGTNAQTFPMRYDYPNTVIQNTNATFITSMNHDCNLLYKMILSSSSRNLYYFGHGGPSRFGRFVDEPVVRNSPKTHRYRFVWLDGCETGLGTWDRAFGINGPGIYPLSNYQQGHRRPGLFVGHSYSIPYAKGPQVTINGTIYLFTIPEHTGFFRSELLFNWYFLNQTFKQAQLAAKNSVAGIGPHGLTYFSGPKKGQAYAFGNDMIWVGYEDLRFNQYNRKNDLP